MKIEKFILCTEVYEIDLEGADKPTVNKIMAALDKIPGTQGISDTDDPFVLVSVEPGADFNDIVKQANEILEG